MSSVSSSSHSSRSSIDEKQLGLLNEKSHVDTPGPVSGVKSWLKPGDTAQLPSSRSLSPRSIARHFIQLFHLLVPSFLHRRPNNDEGNLDKLAPTAFLDGMRGLAAFAVFICHLLYGSFDITHAWGAQPDPAKPPNSFKELVRLPIVRLSYSGPPMVAIFFVISGYALSCKPLKQMRARQHGQLMTTMTSSIFRRGLRLFLPCFASTFLVICLAQLNLYKITEGFALQMRMIIESHCYTQPTFWLQFKDYLVQLLIFVDVFNWSLFAGSIELDRHLWTIPVEFRCSMALFLTHMLTARMSSRLRVMTIIGLIVWGISWDRWDLCPFWAGAVLAEADLIFTTLSASDLPSNTTEALPRTRRRFRFLYWSTFLVSLFLLSFPDTAANVTPGFVTLDALIPENFTEKHRFWPTIGAILIIWSSCRLDVLRNKVFCWAPVHYLGKISFPLYVMHGPVIHTLGYMVS
jgi:peptidoglycan/LPS O-acetylase OafA/YrhL